MKKVAVSLMLLCLLTVTASAAYVPENVVSENRDGRQLIIKTYTLPPDADPDELIEEPFELEGYSVRLGIESTFGDNPAAVTTIWVVNPFSNLLAVFTPTGLGVTGLRRQAVFRRSRWTAPVRSRTKRRKKMRR